MAMGRFATTRIRPRVPWLLISGCIAAAALVRPLGTAAQHRPDDVLGILHVELGPAGLTAPGVDVVYAAPLFHHPQPELARWDRVYVHGDPAVAAPRPR